MKIHTFGVLAFSVLLPLLTPRDASARVYVRIAPPDPVVEVRRDPPSHRHVWVAGHHRWAHGHYAWVPGHWVTVPRHRSAWVDGHWEHDRRGYYWMDGHWR